MKDSTNTDWNRLVRKTRKRALIWYPAAVRTSAGTTVRSKPSDKLFLMAMLIGMGVLLTGGSFYADIFWQRAVCFVVGAFCLGVAIHRILFPRSAFLPANGDEVIVRYGFFLLPTRLVLDRRRVAADYQLGSETELPRGWGGLKIVSLRHVETQEVAHLGYTMKRDDALRVFDALTATFASIRQADEESLRSEAYLCR